ncbi:MAG: hypothetical protein SPG61_05905 [Arcanobacterium sp.]|nr:hypothetical protein [Arcanobacterium sp.]
METMVSLEQWQGLVKAIVEAESPLLTAGTLLVGKNLDALNESLLDEQIRDGVMMAFLTGKWINDGEEFKEILTNPSAPNMDVVEAGVGFLKALTRTNAENTYAAWAMAAYMYWWCGLPIHADSCVLEALELNPNYSLAVLIDEALEVNLPSPIHSSLQSLVS